MMKNGIEFPNELLDNHDKIKKKFAKISMDWKKYHDEIIPEDLEFGIEIIDFIVSVLEYMEKNYDSLDINMWMEFLGTYQYEFYYGSSGDDRNYLSFDEADLIDIFLIDIGEWRKGNSKKKVAKVKKAFLDAKKALQNG